MPKPRDPMDGFQARVPVEADEPPADADSSTPASPSSGVHLDLMPQGQSLEDFQAVMRRLWQKVHGVEEPSSQSKQT